LFVAFSSRERLLASLETALFAVVWRHLQSVALLFVVIDPQLRSFPRKDLIVREILSAIARLKQQGLSILLVEQNARAALRISSLGYVLETGTLVMQGAAETLLADEKMVQTYLGSPAARVF
jgi:branched-chain amino acid transport system ATP-binding protein